MKILQVAPCMHPSWGGPVRMVEGISKHLARKGHRITIYTSDFRWNEATSFENMNEVRFHFSKNLDFNIANFSKLCISLDIYKALDKEVASFDVIHLHEYRTFQNLIIHYYAQKNHIPYVLQAHGSLPRISTKQKLKWIYDLVFGYRLLRDASKVIALSSVEAEQYRTLGVPEDKIEIIPNGIDPAEYCDLPPKGVFKKKFRIDENVKIILYLGRIHRTKGIDFLIKSFAHLIKDLKRKDTILVIAGPDDGYLKEAKSLSNCLGIFPLVMFTGMLSGEDKAEAYVDAVICAYLSQFEAFGIVPLEAAACGKPVIVSEGTHMSDIVNKGNLGFSVKYGAINELAEIMQKALNNVNILRDMEHAGRKFIFENYNWTKIVANLEKVYEEAILCGERTGT